MQKLKIIFKNKKYIITTHLKKKKNTLKYPRSYQKHIKDLKRMYSLALNVCFIVSSIIVMGRNKYCCLFKWSFGICKNFGVFFRRDKRHCIMSCSKSLCLYFLTETYLICSHPCQEEKKQDLTSD